MRRFVLITLLTAITPWLNAQRLSAQSLNAQRMGPVALPIALPRPAVRGSALIVREDFGSSHRRPFFPLALFSDPFYSDALYSAGYPVASQPPVIILQATLAPNATPDHPPAQPLLIELQGDRYVRVSGEGTSGAQTIDQEASPSRPLKSSDAAFHAPAAPELAPAVLIFRDGHREEVTDYTIADGVLYASSNYYTDGSWNKKIELSSLNLPETVKFNHSRGVSFQLPTAPNEVITRP